MKFSTREDIAAPIDHVFAQVGDFAMFERQALRRGADVQRVDQGPVRTGSAWNVAFAFRGKERRMKVVLSELDAPQMIRAEGVVSGIAGLTTIELLALSPKRTRLSVSIDLTPSTLTARLLLQSLKLAKANLNGRFKKRIGTFAQDIEDRWT